MSEKEIIQSLGSYNKKKDIKADSQLLGIALLVEDNQQILDINCRMLEKEGILVLTAKTIAEARERIKLARPDVAVLDIMMPDGSGIDFLSELRQLYETPSNPV
ncbi:MAG: response regulator, partial [Spirochaetaceae bacterium]|nr:response regulator [Spirochaetaceae bacterium]